MRKTIKLLAIIVLLVFAILVVLVIDLSPATKEDANQQVDNADLVQPLVKELRNTLRSRYKAQQIIVSEAQANSLSGFLHRAVGQANALVALDDSHLDLVISYRIDTFILPLYFNLSLTIEEGDGLIVNQGAIGGLSLPGEWVLSFAEYAANTYTNSVVATKAITTVESIDIHQSNIAVKLKPLDSLLREFKNIETGGSKKDAKLLKIKIAHYLRLFDSTYVAPKTNPKSPGNSLGVYLQVAMAEAFVQSRNGSATLENEAAILALAIYAGSTRFTALTGDLGFAINTIPSASPKPVLAGRRDLSLHFVFSAAIKLMSQKGISIAVGEFKELMDRGVGGSGYSFVDLAADLSGAHFADLAVNPTTAQYLQQVMLTDADEAMFMISIEGLEEGLSKQEFADKYTVVDSEAYKQVVNLINQRIADLPISTF